MKKNLATKRSVGILYTAEYSQRAFNDTTQGYNEARAEYARNRYLIDSTIEKSLPQARK